MILAIDHFDSWKILSSDFDSLVKVVTDQSQRFSKVI